MITFGSLFAGIGGFDLGFERAGMTCKWQVEIDPYARQVLAKHWPDVRRHDDIKTWPTTDTERVDVICGGFPCQDISFAGKGAGIHGERSGLFFELIRVVREMGPRLVVLENVPAILARGRGMDHVLGALAEIGFDAEWDCIRTGLHRGHKRDRIFLVAYPVCEGLPSTWQRGKTAREATRFFVESASASLPWAQHSPHVVRGVHGVPRRMDRIRCLGNAVVPQVAEWIGRRIVHIATIQE